MTKRELGIGVAGLIVGLIAGIAAKDEPKNITPRLQAANDDYIDIDAAFKEARKEPLFDKASRITGNAAEVITSKETKDVINSTKDLINNLGNLANAYNDCFNTDKRK
jgi:hypothetical protein